MTRATPVSAAKERLARLSAAGLLTRRARWVGRLTARRRGHAPRHWRRGFTLVEILATLVLAAIILPVAMSGISLALNVADESRSQTEAASLAQTKMAEIVACALWNNTSQSGDFSPDRPDYRWSALVHDWMGTRIRQLDVEVVWSRRGRDRHVVLSTLVYTGDSQ